MLRACATVVTLVGSGIVVSYCVFGRKILEVIFGAEYRAAYPLLCILAAGQLINLAVGSCGQVLMMTGHQKTLMKISLLVVVASIALAIPVAGTYGVVGVAALFSISTVVQSVVTLLAVKQKLGIWTMARAPSRNTLQQFRALRNWRG